MRKTILTLSLVIAGCATAMATGFSSACTGKVCSGYIYANNQSSGVLNLINVMTQKWGFQGNVVVQAVAGMEGGAPVKRAGLTTTKPDLQGIDYIALISFDSISLGAAVPQHYGSAAQSLITPYIGQFSGISLDVEPTYLSPKGPTYFGINYGNVIQPMIQWAQDESAKLGKPLSVSVYTSMNAYMKNLVDTPTMTKLWTQLNKTKNGYVILPTYGGINCYNMGARLQQVKTWLQKYPNVGFKLDLDVTGQEMGGAHGYCSSATSSAHCQCSIAQIGTVLHNTIGRSPQFRGVALYQWSSTAGPAPAPVNSEVQQLIIQNSVKPAS